MQNKRGLIAGAEGFLIGGIVGGAIALLFAPQSGNETRYDINKYMRFARFKRRKMVSEAHKYSREIIKNAQEILDKTKTFSAGKYNGTLEGFEKEITSLKAGFNKAVNTYKYYPGTEKEADNMVEEIFVNFDETMPKHEGMRRRIN